MEVLGVSFAYDEGLLFFLPDISLKMFFSVLLLWRSFFSKCERKAYIGIIISELLYFTWCKQWFEAGMKMRLAGLKHLASKSDKSMRPKLYSSLDCHMKCDIDFANVSSSSFVSFSVRIHLTSILHLYLYMFCHCWRGAS